MKQVGIHSGETFECVFVPESQYTEGLGDKPLRPLAQRAKHKLLLTAYRYSPRYRMTLRQAELATSPRVHDQSNWGATPCTLRGDHTTSYT